MKLYLPIKPAPTSQGFGQNLNPLYAQLGMKGHNGIDYPCATGTPVYASHAGEITFTGLDGANGKLCVIKSDETFKYNGIDVYFKTLYVHLDSYCVKAGEHVELGQLIAYSDNTGASTGPHLHFGLKPILQGEPDWQWYNVEQDNGYNGAIDPLPYLVFEFACDVASKQTKISNLWKAFVKTITELISSGASAETITSVVLATGERSQEINKQ